MCLVIAKCPLRGKIIPVETTVLWRGLLHNRKAVELVEENLSYIFRGLRGDWSVGLSQELGLWVRQGQRKTARELVEKLDS